MPRGRGLPAFHAVAPHPLWQAPDHQAPAICRDADAAARIAALFLRRHRAQQPGPGPLGACRLAASQLPPPAPLEPREHDPGLTVKSTQSIL